MKAEIATPREFLGAADIPEIATEAVGRCAVCGGDDLHDTVSGYDYELRTCRNLWQFRECAACGHVQLDPRPAVAALPVIYPAHYYSYDMENSVGPVARAGKGFLDRRKFADILRHLGRVPHSYLDIGCGDLKYLKLMQRLGVASDALFGIEIDARVAERAKQAGYNVANERIETAKSIPPGRIELATMFHVIEHVAEPDAVIRKIAQWLTPGGVLAIETPNFDSLDARLFRGGFWGGYHMPRHWHLFSCHSLRTLLEQNGFTIEAVSYQTGHSFWLYSLHHLLRYNRLLPMPRLARLFDPLKSLSMLVIATLFDTVRAKLGCHTSAMLFIARNAPAPPAAAAP